MLRGEVMQSSTARPPGYVMRVTRVTCSGVAATQFMKTHFNRPLQELFLTKRQVPLSQFTQANLLKVLTFLDGRLPS
jgi:hypothetical protein